MIIDPDGAIEFDETDTPLPSAGPFPDLRAAGRELAAQLETYRNREDAVVLALIMGGVLVGHEVAAHLRLPLDYVILRRLMVPNGPGDPVCAVNVAGKLETVGDLPPQPQVPVTGLDFFLADALASLEQREKICRGGRVPLDLRNKTVIMIDCGMRSGQTMKTAIKAVRLSKPVSIVVAQPVASVGATATVKPEVDEFVCLGYPRPFGNVGVWYKDFSRPSEDQLSGLLS
jgi:putative phosphoribosyl transferase